MRRLYESRAVKRDDDDQFTPSDHRDRDADPQALRHVPGTRLSRLLVPNRLRYRAISVNIETRRDEYDEGTAISFVVTMHNGFPIPIEVPTLSPVLWTWAVDGATNASRVDLRNPPQETRGFRFDRGERKQFKKTWDQRFRVSESRWERARPGEYVLSAALNIDSPQENGLYDESTVRIK